MASGLHSQILARSPNVPEYQRHIHHEEIGQQLLLFGREENKANNLATPFYSLGPARYVTHTGSKRMSITWRLQHPLPAKLLRRMGRLAVG